MFDASRVVGLLLESGLPASGPERLEQLAALSAPAQPGLAEAPARFARQQVTVGTVIDNDRATIMLRAMINAAKADARREAEHGRRILTRLEQAGAEPAARQFVIDEMARPSDVDGLVAAVSSQTLAVQVYAASLFAIAVETPSEASYLRELGARLGLDPAFTRELHRSLGIAPVA